MALTAFWLSSCVFSIFIFARANKTELHIAVQTDAFYGDEFMHAWTRHIISYINQKDLIQNYTLVPDFLLEEGTGGDINRGQLLLDLAVYLSTTRAYCYIGNLFSENSVVTADITTAKHILQISPMNSSPLLSDKTRYPYYLRTMPTSNAKVNMLEQMLTKYNWKRFAVILENAEPQTSHYNNFLNHLAKMNRTAELTATYTGDPSNVIQRLKTSGIKIFISISWSTTITRIMCEANRAGLTGKRFVWVMDYIALSGTRSTWWDYPIPSGTTCSPQEWVNGLENQFEAVLDPSKDQNQQTILNKTLNNIKEEVAVSFPNATIPWDNFDALGFYAQLSDALLTCALALNKSKEDVYPTMLDGISYKNGKDLVEALFNASMGLRFKGFSQGSVSFSSSGDVQAIYKVHQVKNGTHGKPVMRYIEADNEMEYQSDKDIWKHIGGTPPLDEDIVITTAISIPEPLFYTYIGFAALSAILAIILVIIQLIFRKRSTVKYSWPHLNAVIAVGCIVVSTVVVLKGFDLSRLKKEQLLTVCKATNWLLVIGFTLTVGAMLSKMWAIYSFFNRQAKGKKTIGESGNMIVIVIMLVIDVVILIAWSLVNPLELEEDKLDENIDFEKQTIYTKLTFTCTSENATYWIIAFLCYKGIVLILAGFLTWPAWMISSRHRVSDSHYLGIAVYVCIISCVIAVPVSFLLQGDPVLQYGLVGGFMQGSVLLTICLILIPKLVALCADTDERISKVNSPIGALFGFMSVLGDSGALPGAGVDQAKNMFAVNMATAMVNGGSSGENADK